MLSPAHENEPTRAMRERARIVAGAGSLVRAIEVGALPKLVDATLAEALVLGLLKQGVSKYFAIFGHGSTELGNVLRVYEEEGVTRTLNCRNEVEMAHAATALRWQYGELSAVVTSIGPGALQAFAGSLAAASNGVGVYHIYGDETTYGDEHHYLRPHSRRRTGPGADQDARSQRRPSDGVHRARRRPRDPA